MPDDHPRRSCERKLTRGGSGNIRTGATQKQKKKEFTQFRARADTQLGDEGKEVRDGRSSSVATNLFHDYAATAHSNHEGGMNTCSLV